MLKTLESASYAKDSTRFLQQELAIKMAKRDYNLNKKLNIKANLKTYTGNSKWFRYFNRKYKQETAKLSGKFWIVILSWF